MRFDLKLGAPASKATIVAVVPFSLGCWQKDLNIPPNNEEALYDRSSPYIVGESLVDLKELHTSAKH